MISISKDGKNVQVWDLLTDDPPLTKDDGLCQGVLGILRNRLNLGMLAKKCLNETARHSGQEIRIHTNDDGWTIEIFSVFGSENEEPVVLSVHIPHDRDETIKVSSVGDVEVNKI